MKHYPVKSSTIATVGYDPDQKRMEVTFKNGTTYEYHDVAPHVHKTFLWSKSLGYHLNAHVARHHKFNKKAPSKK